MALPGVENVPTHQETVLKLSRAPRRPYPPAPCGHTAVRMRSQSCLLAILYHSGVADLVFLHIVEFWSQFSSFLVSQQSVYWLLVGPGDSQLPPTSMSSRPWDPSQILYLQHISHIRHIWPPFNVIWLPWEQKVSQMTSIGSQNGANLTSKMDLKLTSKQKCKTSRNIIIYYVLWRSAT